ncbi:hypothetical protein [Chelativorans sp. M5D2P16]|uniref:hypothetical protein n=1 Tax=Chelativorans sp. M5D2P16 TaxID=3095678 RepID=UPI002ACA6E6B|nr:hypothetical protein [Chelativorans sp. M5D2P16]MDZ5698640.1 hypothetical protein [Chelativorans sp. M5D2P16]
MSEGTALSRMARRNGTAAERQLRARARPDGIPEKLPLVHVTAVGVAREILKSGKLETRHCTVFNKRLLYFFIMRPAYRLRGGDAKSHQINRFPFVFVAEPTAVAPPYHVYPFDTGGAANGIFGEHADPYVFLEDYELAPEHAAVAGQIGWAFGSLEAYFDGEIRTDVLHDVPQHETVTRSFIDITRLARSGSNQPDKRASAIEIASSQDVALKGNVKLAILPKQYLEDASGSNSDFMDRLKAQKIEWDIYDWQPNTAPNEFQDEISRVARAWFKGKGYL